MVSLRLRPFIVAAATAVCSVAPQAGAQQRPATVELRGPTGLHRTVAASTFDSLGRQEVHAQAHNAVGVYGGVPLFDLLRLVGAPGGDSLRGPTLASYVLIEAADGYRVTFSLAELSPTFTDRVVLLTDRKDGAPLPAGEGPFRLVVPDDKRPARWARQVTRITLVLLPAG